MALHISLQKFINIQFLHLYSEALTPNKDFPRLLVVMNTEVIFHNLINNKCIAPKKYSAIKSMQLLHNLIYSVFIRLQQYLFKLEMSQS